MLNKACEMIGEYQSVTHGEPPGTGRSKADGAFFTLQITSDTGCSVSQSSPMARVESGLRPTSSNDHRHRNRYLR
jgi:hypothetical protein